jgi:transposase
MVPPHNQSVSQISPDTGVAVPTLYSWKKLFRNQGFVVPAKSSRPDDWNSKAKLAAIIQTAAMNEAQRSEYCHQYGLYPEQLDAWKAAFESLESDSEPASKADLVQQRKKPRHLEKEILRKDKALAEAAGLTNGDGAIAQMVRLLQFLPPAQRAGVPASQAVQGETSGKLNIPAVLGYGVKTTHQVT